MKHLKIYSAVRLIQRQGSIRKAAELLAVSPSALNRSVQNFEESIGVEIFERIPSGVRLTSAGELLLVVIERHLIEFGELQRQFGNLRDGKAGELQIAIGEDIAAGLSLAAVADLEADMPGVSVTVASGDMLRLLRNRDVDLAVVTNPETDPSVEVLAAHDVPLVAWCHRDHPLHGGRPGIWDLVEGRLVLPPEGTGSRSAISHVLRRHNLKEGVTSSVPAAQLAQAMGGGMRTCIFPGCVLDEETLADRLRPLPLEIGNVQISVLRLSGVPLSRPAQSFLRHMERRLNLEAF